MVQKQGHAPEARHRRHSQTIEKLQQSAQATTEHQPTQQPVEERRAIGGEKPGVDDSHATLADGGRFRAHAAPEVA